MPHMCCAGTVATTLADAATNPASRRQRSSCLAFSDVVAQKLPQYLRCGVGVPVLPEVKPIAARVLAAMSGGGQRGSTGAESPGSKRQQFGTDRAGIADRLHAVEVTRQVGQRGRAAIRRQQRRQAADQRCGEAEQEAVAILAEIENVSIARQRPCQRMRLAQELLRADRRRPTPGEHARRLAAQQGQRVGAVVGCWQAVHGSSGLIDVARSCAGRAACHKPRRSCSAQPAPCVLPVIHGLNRLTTNGCGGLWFERPHHEWAWWFMARQRSPRAAGGATHCSLPCGAKRRRGLGRGRSAPTRNRQRRRPDSA